MSTSWDPDQYLRFADERARPFEDLLGRVGHPGPAVVVDLGCGPGNVTVRLTERWPEASVIGIDTSEEMIREAAERFGERQNLAFRLGDLREWPLPGVAAPDVLTCAATLQWVPGHLEVLPRLLGGLAPGGWFAMQVPGNFGAPSHVLMRELATSERWRDLLGGAVDASPDSEEPEEYLKALLDAGARHVDVWETTYLHVLQGSDAVLEWVKGTGLRPFLQGLDRSARPGDREEFLAAYGAALRAAYPPDEAGRTVLPFRRIFAVAASAATGASSTA